VTALAIRVGSDPQPRAASATSAHWGDGDMVIEAQVGRGIRWAWPDRTDGRIRVWMSGRTVMRIDAGDPANVVVHLDRTAPPDGWDNPLRAGAARTSSHGLGTDPGRSQIGSDSSR
jgi:hypothetical protein